MAKRRKKAGIMDVVASSLKKDRSLLANFVQSGTIVDIKVRPVGAKKRRGGGGGRRRRKK